MTASPWLNCLRSPASTATNRRMPTTSSEKKLCEFWVDVLHHPVEEIGAEDNLKHVGGDSIEAMNLTRRCRAEGF